MKQTKVCKAPECGLEKNLNEFYTFPGTKDGHAWICKDCHDNRQKPERKIPRLSRVRSDRYGIYVEELINEPPRDDISDLFDKQEED